MISSEIFNAALKGDSKAFEYIFRMTKDKAYSVAISVVKDEYDAEDIVQDAYVIFQQKIASIREADKLEAWLYRIVKNRAIDFLRKNRPAVFSAFEGGAENEDFVFEDTLVSDYQDFSPEENLDYSETKRMINGILDGLPEKQRICIVMRYAEGLKISEIAERTGYPEATVKSCLKYGKDKISGEVQELEKKGTKLYGISAFAIIPFLRWMLGGSLSGSASGTIPNIAGNVVKKGVSKVVKRIIAGVAATAVVGTIAVTVPVSDGFTISDYVVGFLSGQSPTEMRRNLALESMLDFMMIEADGSYFYEELDRVLEPLTEVNAVCLWFYFNDESSSVSKAYDMKYVLGVPSDTDFSAVYYAFFGKKYEGTFGNLATLLFQSGLALDNSAVTHHEVEIKAITEENDRLKIIFSSASNEYIGTFRLDSKCTFGFVYEKIEKK